MATATAIPVAYAQAATAQASQAYDIPAGSLADALNRFAERSGVKLFYDASLTTGLTTPGLKGTFGPAEALSRLLAGTGLTYRQSGAGAFTLQQAPRSAGDAVLLGPVRVQGESGQAAAPLGEYSAWSPVRGYVAHRSATGTKTDTPLIEAPQTINVVTPDQIAAVGAQTIGQSLRYTPGIYAERTGAITTDDNFTIRGFTARTYVDGIRQPVGNLTSTQIDPYGLERIEILKGPSSVLYGRSAPGGIANLVRKRPTDEAMGEVELLAGSYNRFQGKFDASSPINDAGTLLFRVTSLVRGAETQMDYVDDNRMMLAGSFAFRPSADTDLNLFASYQDDKSGVGSFFAEGTLLPNINGPVPSNVYLGTSTDKYERRQWLLGYRLDHDFGNGIRLRSSADYTDTKASIQYPLVSGLGEDERTAARRYLGITPEKFHSLTLDNSLEFAVDTGAIGHRILVGVDYMHAKGNRDDIPIYLDVDEVDIFDPDNSPGYVAHEDRYTNLYFTQNQWGIYLQDQMSIGRLRLTVGGRHDWSDTDSWTYYLSPPDTRQRDRKLTGRAGAVYLFDNGLAPFVSWSTSFEPEPGATFEGQLFRPTTGRQFEAGVRFQPPGSNLYLYVSAFDLRQRNVLAPDPVNPFFNVQLGEVSSRGIEAEAKASLADGLSATASYSYTKARIRKSSVEEQIGRRLHFVPPVQASLWADYAFGGADPVGVSLGAGVRHIGRQYGDADNTPALRIPAETLFDAKLGLDLSRLTGWREGLTAQVNINNIFNERYVTGCSSALYAFCYLGQKRTILGSIAYRW